MAGWCLRWRIADRLSATAIAFESDRGDWPMSRFPASQIDGAGTNEGAEALVDHVSFDVERVAVERI